ncbi:hypothetical protein L1765_13545 [Microaerobacter geothermalis]|uniref:MGDG synthase family glycosyltransferase n=1 Tax=Microaerobacter geothermalis TaxID=674972 RepID=UPI001F492C6E|nr:glycosyltransferase [Microaerobacter geothermalis]MCF6094985.1 hypothetical protein [Microaerobacter geothermalis]
MSKKIIMMTENVAGLGHTKAAESLAMALAKVDTNVECRIIPMMNLVHPHVEKVSREAYYLMIKHVPRLWGILYDNEQWLSFMFKNKLAKLWKSKLEKFFQDEKPDLVVATHAFCLGAASLLRREGIIPSLGAVITDYGFNGFWVYPDIDFYIVPHEDIKEYVRKKFGISGERIWPTGIPIHPDFSEFVQTHKEELRKKMDLEPKLITILLTGGGWGFGPMEEILQHLLTIPTPLQILVITGNNTKLYQRLSKIQSDHHHIRVFGYISSLIHVMAVCDLIITKPGGLTTAEALALNIPLFIHESIYGQESRNASFLLERGLAHSFNTPKDLVYHLQGFINDFSKLEHIRHKTNDYGKPSSSYDSAKRILHHLQFLH